MALGILIKLVLAIDNSLSILSKTEEYIVKILAGIPTPRTATGKGSNLIFLITTYTVETVDYIPSTVLFNLFTGI